jgi:hypothetical protein
MIKEEKNEDLVYVDQSGMDTVFYAIMGYKP